MLESIASEVMDIVNKNKETFKHDLDEGFDVGFVIPGKAIAIITKSGNDIKYHIHTDYYDIDSNGFVKK